MIKALRILAIWLIILLCMVGCGEHIEDLNPNDPALGQLSLDDLAGRSISSRSSGMSTSTVRNNRTIVSGHLEEYDLDRVVLRGGVTSGVQNIMATRINEGQTLTIRCESSVEKGNLGLVLIDENNEILHVFPINASEAFSVTATERMVYIVRMGAESYTGEITVIRTIS